MSDGFTPSSLGVPPAGRWIELLDIWTGNKTKYLRKSFFCSVQHLLPIKAFLLFQKFGNHCFMDYATFGCRCGQQCQRRFVGLKTNKDICYPVAIKSPLFCQKCQLEFLKAQEYCLSSSCRPRCVYIGCLLIVRILVWKLQSADLSV